jgi:hypothetical protein
MRVHFFRKRRGPNPKLHESPPALPAQPETPDDGHLAGLLTYASANLKRLPGFLAHSRQQQARMGTLPSGMLLKFSANTVAGQWRILTALPITRWKKIYMRQAVEVKAFGN